jgi:hypothetical protein
MLHLTMIGLAAVILSLVSPIQAFFPSPIPDYCSKDMTRSIIPDLSTDQLARVSNLLQVQIVNRHGARTPYSLYSCWNNYTVTWNDCNVTELETASPSYTSQDIPAKYIFRKIYDGSANYLGGNCLTGQLISDGYVQHGSNGEYLQNAYLKQADGKLNLFPTTSWEDIDTEHLVYLRSDDEERTILSGQILVHAMFNVTEQQIVPWHTGDYNLDQIYPNSKVCPRLNQVEANWEASASFMEQNSSSAVTTLTADLTEIWGEGMWSWYNAMDCMMTTVCTERAMPDGTVSTPMTQELFDNAVAESTYQLSGMYVWNNSQYAKLCMGNTAWHVRNNIMKNLNSSYSVAGKGLKLAVFSAHDTTVMPFLAAILGANWDMQWATYAAMVTIELYNRSTTTPQTTDEEHLFRMVYNGKTLLVPGCDDSLCNLSVLLDALSFGQEAMPCSVPASDDISTSSCSGGSSEKVGSLNLGEWVMIVFLGALVGALVGAGAVVFYDKRRLEKDLYVTNGVEETLNPSHA